MHALFKEQAEYATPFLKHVDRIELADEPVGPPYSHFVSCDFCKAKFAAGLKAQGLTPGVLGETAWGEVVPVPPAEKE